MKLLVTMSRNRLLAGLDRMFPGASSPVQGQDPHADNSGTKRATPGRGRAALIDLLVTGKKPLYGADEVERITGIHARNLRREMETPAVATAAKSYGWSAKPAKEVGRSGRMTFLVHQARFGAALLAGS